MPVDRGIYFIAFGSGSCGLVAQRGNLDVPRLCRLGAGTRVGPRQSRQHSDRIGKTGRKCSLALARPPAQRSAAIALGHALYHRSRRSRIFRRNDARDRRLAPHLLPGGIERHPIASDACRRSRRGSGPRAAHPQFRRPGKFRSTRLPCAARHRLAGIIAERCSS